MDGRFITRWAAIFAAAALLPGLGHAAPAPVAPSPAADPVADANTARMAMLARKYDQAIKLFTRAIESNGLNSLNQAIALNLRASAYLEKGQDAAAQADLDASLKLADTADARFTRGRLAADQQHFDAAADDLTRALALGAKAADVYAYRGYAYLFGGKLDLALKDLDQAIAVQPAYDFAYLTRGHAYLNRHEDDKAIADETKAIALNPKSAEAHWLRAYAYHYRKDAPDKALADYSAALLIEPADTDVRAQRAETYEDMGRYGDAVADYAVLIHDNPKVSAAYRSRGRLELMQGRAAEAAADLAKAVSLEPQDGYNTLWLHIARLKSGADDKAEFAANAAHIDAIAWPGPVVQYFAGHVTAEVMLGRATQGAGAAAAGQACEAQLFLSQEDFAQGRKVEGTQRLQAAAKGCDPTSRAARLIKAQLDGPPTAAKTQVAAADAPVKLAKAAPALASTPTKPKTQIAQGGDMLLRGSLK